MLYWEQIYIYKIQLNVNFQFIKKNFNMNVDLTHLNLNGGKATKINSYKNIFVCFKCHKY